ncbi:MAG TPA: CHASE4 domain-containing protein [Geminicoccus sp.]|jgi:sensor domain CHASE-containing protein|uniref:CHASE4 domain-containing protein n=1 Tax=Geminicoccus sp. TaxID=2024832 RepID=UPI002E2F85AB|nr:CHASE4 domain-containing protein [Geminicoccus sp.]HEX2528728.1 CHASE4 domain-containing protein [Geminicoccus sp.]
MVADKVSDNRFASTNAWPAACQLLAMLVCTCLAVFGGLAIIAQADDQGDLRDSQSLLRTAIDVSEGELARNARDYANWGELYENSQNPPNSQWLADNLGLSVSQNLAIDAQYLLMPDDRLGFAFVNGKLMAPGSPIDLDSGLEQLLTRRGKAPRYHRRR